MLKLIIDNKFRCSFALVGDNSNCKLSYIHNIGWLKHITTKDNERKEIIDKLLEYQKGCVFINTINKDLADFINKTYPTYFYEEVPIGYNGGYQYHICIKNVIKINHYCRTPEKKSLNKQRNNKGGHTKTKVEKLLRTHLKQNNQSTRFVNKFIRELQNK